ncbi:MAG: hypothetical protein GEU83_20185 [Pseudonocardiaceae bacterium]|nr:hypothetical protein [Pseudonocardiaceae bacterium]
MTAEGNSVLVVASETDPAADGVCRVLAERHARVFRFDTAEIPQAVWVRAKLSGGVWQGELVAAKDRVNLEEICSVYVRGPRPFEPPPHLTEIERWHSAMECRYALGGVLASIPGVRWCNMPAASADAAYKPKQLQDFHACGLATPATLLTSDAQSVREFAATAGQLICKPVAVGVVRTGHGSHVAYTRRVTADDLENLAGVDYSIHCFQAYVDALYSVRLTVVGDNFFAVRIDAGSERARVDWRSDYPSLRYQVIDTPPEIREGVGAYMETAGLTYSAWDFGVTPEGWIAYEANPEGQFGWIEQETGVPITTAIADILIERQDQS